MGLAPYGNPKYANLILQNMIDVKTDGSFRLNQEYFAYCTSLVMISRRFEDLFMKRKRLGEEPLEQFHMDVAASIQLVTEDILIKITDHLAQQSNVSNLCLAGGVALNCVANGKIMRRGKFKNLWI